MNTYNTQGHPRWDLSDLNLDRPNLTELLPQLQNHQVREREWNSNLTNVVSAPFGFRRTPEHPTLFRYVNGAETDLWDSALADGTRFRDVPMQKPLVAMVVMRKHGANANMETQRNSVGTHNPDLTTLLSEGLVDDPTTTLRVLSLAGEIKVTRIRARNGKLVIAVDPDNDVELTEDMATHYSIPSASGDKAKLVRVDEGIKWTAGLSKAVIYLQSQYEYCGGYLSASVLGTRFCRIVMADSGHVILEVSSAFLIAATTTALRIHDFLNDQTNVASLPWDMCDDHPGAFPEHSWNTDAMDRLLQLHKVAADILTSHTASHADQPFCRLTPVRDLAGVRELLEEIASSSLPAPLDKDDDLRISRAVKGEPGPSALGLGPTTRSQTMSGATSESGIQRSTAPPAYHGQSDLQEDTTVRRWRESLPAVLDTSPGVPPILTSPPELAFEDGVIADDKEWDSVLEAHDMPMDLERGREWVRQHVAPDSDFESDDEGEHVLLADMLKALEERNVRVTLVDTDKMDRLVGAIEKAVCA